MYGESWGVGSEEGWQQAEEWREYGRRREDFRIEGLELFFYSKEDSGPGRALRGKREREGERNQ